MAKISLITRFRLFPRFRVFDLRLLRGRKVTTFAQKSITTSSQNLLVIYRKNLPAVIKNCESNKGSFIKYHFLLFYIFTMINNFYLANFNRRRSYDVEDI